MPAYNYYNPYAFQPQQMPMDQYQQVYKPPQSLNPINNYGMIWAKGIEAAKAYPQAPSTNLIIWDSDTDVFYKKTTDAQGKPIEFRVFDYNEREIQNENSNNQPPVQQTNDELSVGIRSLESKMDKLISVLSEKSSSKETQESKPDRMNKRSKEVFSNAQSNV